MDRGSGPQEQVVALIRLCLKNSRLPVPALFFAWIIGSIGIATVPGTSGGWKVAAVVGLSLILTGEGAFLYWHFHRQGPGTMDGPASENESSKSLDLTVQLSCEWSQLPTVVPQHKLYELQLILGMGGAFTSFSQQPGTQINLVSPDAPTYAYRCRFSNLGPSSIVNLAVEMPMSFMESIKSSDGTRSGAVIATYKVDTPLIVLESGKTFDFYVRNYSPVYANMALPTVAFGQVVGSDKLETFRLIPSQAVGFGMPPFERSQPPKPANVSDGTHRRAPK